MGMLHSLQICLLLSHLRCVPTQIITIKHVSTHIRAANCKQADRQPALGARQLATCTVWCQGLTVGRSILSDCGPWLGR